jgi:hypothetical protein
MTRDPSAGDKRSRAECMEEALVRIGGSRDAAMRVRLCCMFMIWNYKVYVG